MSITIKTHLNAGIYKSSGGGEIRTHHESVTGPRNLLKAVATLSEHRARMRCAYGNIGCGSSWLEIDGTRIDDSMFYGIDTHDADGMSAYDRAICHYTLLSPTAKARALIEQVRSGEYAAWVARCAAADADDYMAEAA